MKTLAYLKLFALSGVLGFSTASFAVDYTVTQAGNWSTATWNPATPAAGGDSTYSIRTGVTGNQSYTNDLGAGPDREFLLNSVVWVNGGPLFAGDPLFFVPDAGVQPSIVNGSVNTPNRAFPFHNAIRIQDGAILTISGYETGARGANVGTGYDFLGRISGAADIVVNATANPDDSKDYVTFSTANDFTGQLFINRGTVAIGNEGALGSTDAGTTVAEGGQLRLKLGQMTIAEPLSLAGTGQGTQGAVFNVDGTNTLTGPISISGVTTRIGSGAGTLTVRGGITGDGQTTLLLSPDSRLIVENTPINVGTALVRVHGANVCDWNVGGNVFGSLEVAWRSTLRLNAPNAVPAGAFLAMGFQNNNVSGVGTLDLNGYDITVGSLNSAGSTPQSLSITSAAPATLTVDDPNQSTYAGRLDGEGLSLVKNNYGLLTLTGENSYGGDTTINAGKITWPTTSHAGGGAITVADYAEMEVKVESAGTSLPASALTLPGPGSKILTFDMGLIGNPTAPVIATTNLTASGSVMINLLGSGFRLGRFTLITNYSGVIGGSGFSAFYLGAPPNGVTATLVNVDNSLAVQITSAAGLRWTGAASADWDYSTLNWFDELTSSPTTYSDSYTVRFLDGAMRGDVDLLVNPVPPIVVVSNSALAYRFSGSGTLFTSALRKEGDGVLTLATEYVNPFTTLDLSQGTVVIDHPYDSTFTTVLTSSKDNSGTLTKANPTTLTLDANNSAYEGTIRIEGGTLIPTTPAALGSTTGPTVVAEGGTLDVNNRNLGVEPVIASGAGATGAGAIIDGTASGAVETSLRNLILAGDTTIGGPGRFDIRAASATDPGLIGNGHKLTKLGPNWIAIGGDNNVAFNTDLGDIEVKEGTLSIEGGANAGRPTNNLVVFPGAMFTFFNTGPTNIQVKNLLMTDATIRLSGPPAGGGSGIFGGPVVLSGSNRFEVLNKAVYTFTNEISGEGPLVKTANGPGGGTLVLSASNSYSGLTLVEANGAGSVGYNGKLRIQHARALGTLNVGTTVKKGGSLELDGPLGEPLLEPLTLAGGGGDGSPGALNNLAGDNTIAAPITLSDPGTGTRIANQAPGTVLTIDVPSGAAITTVGEANALWISGNSIVAINDPVELVTGEVRIYGTATLWLNSTLDMPVTVDRGTLGGTGTINNSVNVTGGTLAPGTSVGTLTINGDLTMTNNAVFELDKSVSPANDRIVVNGAFEIGGTLVVSNVGPALVAGDVFTLFNKPATGEFSEVVLPSLAPGLTWENRLAVDGSVAVVGSPAALEFSGLSLSGDNMVLSGSGGTPDGTYYLLSSPDLTLPLSGWTPVLTNAFDSNGEFSIEIPVNPAEPQLFYRLQLP